MKIPTNNSLPLLTFELRLASARRLADANFFCFPKDIDPNIHYNCQFHFLISKTKNYFVFQDPDILETNGIDHNHGPGEEVLLRENRLKLKEVSANRGLITRDVVNTAAKGLNPDELDSLPQTVSMKRLVQRARKKENVPKNPEKRTGFLIDEKYSNYCGKPFLRYDSGMDDDDRILIFVTDEGIKDLENYGHWSSDGTFKSSPKIFYQMFLIHVHINNTQTVPR